MPTKLTHEMFMEKFLMANDHDLTILSKYVNASVKIHVKCNIHDLEFDAIPSSLLRNSGCKICGIENVAASHRLSDKEFIEKLYDKNEHFRQNEFEIIGEYYNNKTHIACKCNKCDYRWDARPDSLLNGTGCPECGRFSRWDWKRLTHEQFIDMARLTDRKIKVLDKYILSTVPIRFECEKGHVWRTTPSGILAGHGCPYCAGSKVLVGFNDLWTTHPYVARFLVDPSDGYKYTFGSNKMVKFRCPDCGYVKEKSILQVSQHGIQCSVCSDGVSYPNKFARALLDQLPVNDYMCEYRPDWAKPYLYDNFFEYNGEKYILEMDGAFHYKEVANADKTLEEVREIDQIKTHRATNRGINVIRIDCFDATCDYIKHNLLLSKLNDIFDLSCIDWDLCDKKAQKSLIKEACDLYMTTTKKFSEIANILHIHSNTVYHYMKIGAKFGWCDYDPRVTRKAVCDKKAKKVVIVDDNDNIMHVFDGLRPCERDMKSIYGVIVYRKSIVNACQTHKPYKGFNFRFTSETIQN